MQTVPNEVQPLTAVSGAGPETYVEAMARIERLHRWLLEVINNEFSKIASTLQPSSVAKPIGDVKIEPQSSNETRLTARQRQVLEFLVEGKSNKEIARSLCLGEGTVKVHMAALFRNLGATNRARAAVVGASFVRASRSLSDGVRVGLSG
jgi:DNA-binding NarL/FixJ family response regulator